jgi:hypothetical protein
LGEANEGGRIKIKYKGVADAGEVGGGTDALGEVETKLAFIKFLYIFAVSKSVVFK